MTEYRRAKLEGATYFFTVNCAERHSNHLLVDPIDLVRQIFRKIKSEHPFEIDAMVVLPEAPTLYLDFAARRCGLPNPLGFDQGRVFSGYADR